MAIPKEDRNARYDRLMDEELGYITGEPVADAEPMKLASLSGGLAHLFTQGIKRKMPKATEGMEDVIPEIKAVTPDLEKRTRDRNINIHRHRQGAQRSEVDNFIDVRSADEAMQLLDQIGAQYQLFPDGGDVVRHSQIAEETGSMTQILDHLKPVLAGEQKGLLDKVQMNAARNLLATLADEMKVLSKEIVDGNTTAEQLAKYKQREAAFASIQSLVQNNARELARALNQQNMIAQSMEYENAKMLLDALGPSGGKDAVIKHAQMLHDKMNADGALGFVDAMSTPTMLDYRKAIVEFWKGNLLLNPATHGANIGGNALTNFYEIMLVKPTAAAIGTIPRSIRYARNKWRQANGHKPILRSEDVTFTEAASALHSGFSGIYNGLRAAAAAMSYKENMDLPHHVPGSKLDTEGSIERIATYLAYQMPGVGRDTAGLAGQIFQDVATPAYKILTAEDEFFKGLAYTVELKGQAARHAYSLGLDGSAARQKVAEIMNNPSQYPQLREAAYQQALMVTFQDQKLTGIIGIIADGVKKATAQVPELGFIMPYITTPTNILNYTIRNTPLQALSPQFYKDLAAGGARAEIASARFVLGTGLMVGAYALHQNGLITGNGPENHALRRQLEQTGWKPNAIYVDGKYWQINRLDPMGAIIGMVADGLDRTKYAAEESDMQDVFIESAIGLARHMVDATYMRGMDQTMAALRHGGPSMTKLLADYQSAFIPYQSATKAWAQVVDDKQRTLERKFHKMNLTERLMFQLEQRAQRVSPYHIKYLRPARYWDGEIVTGGDGWMNIWNALTPVRVGDARKRYDAANDALIANDVAVNEPSPIVTLGKGQQAISFSLLDLDGKKGIVYDAYIEAVGKERRRQVNEAMKSESYRKGSKGAGGERAAILDSAIRKAKIMAHRKFFDETLRTVLDKHPDTRTVFSHLVGENWQAFLDDVNKDAAPSEVTRWIERGAGRVIPAAPHQKKARQEQELKITF